MTDEAIEDPYADDQGRIGTAFAAEVGPTLAGVFGRLAGTVDGFKYSDAMKSSGLIWDDANIDAYLEKPKKFMPGNKMVFPGLKKPDDRANLIEFLKGATQ